MTDLDWHKTPAGYVSGGYVIHWLADGRNRRWRLETHDPRPTRTGSVLLATSVHRTAQEAMKRAERDERDRIRHTRVIGHLIVAAVATLFLTALIAFIDRLAVYIFFTGLLFVALRSFTDALEVLLADAWGWTRDRTWSSRLVLGASRRWRRRTQLLAEAEPEPAIRMLPPYQPD